jgi:hypothetical protein
MLGSTRTLTSTLPKKRLGVLSMARLVGEKRRAGSGACELGEALGSGVAQRRGGAVRLTIALPGVQEPRDASADALFTRTR